MSSRRHLRNRTAAGLARAGRVLVRAALVVGVLTLVAPDGYG